LFLAIDDPAPGEGVPSDLAKGLARHKAAQGRTGIAKVLDGMANEAVYITRQTLGIRSE
jgi:hypothetical protein